MSEALCHRGPDARGLWLSDDQKIAFAHRRLSIVDLSSRANQPMTRGDRLSIVFNGEIYNFRELRKSLISSGAVFETNSDTEVLLELYQREGEQMIHRLRGMFAFAIWDGHRRRLFCARDRFGMKPFYYGISEGVLFFSSEIKALLSIADSLDLVPEVLAELEAYQFLLTDQTPFHGITELRGGHVLFADTSGVRVSCFWSPKTRESNPTKSPQENVREALMESVAEHLVGDVGIAAYLSGGADSSIVYSVASAKLQETPEAFHGSFGGFPEYNETRFAQAVVREIGGGQFHNVEISSQDFFETLPAALLALDFPIAGPGVVPQFIMSKRVSQSHKVVLGGQGGDELFGGYARHALMMLNDRTTGDHKRAAEAAGHLRAEDAALLIPSLKGYERLAEKLSSSGQEDRAERYSKLLFRAEFSTNHESALTERAKSLFISEYVKLEENSDFEYWSSSMLAFDLKFVMPSLLQVEDRVSMANGIESRLPFLDHRLAELALHFSPRALIGSGEPKGLLKDAFRNLLPVEVRDRKDKMGFPVPLSDWANDRSQRHFILSALRLTDKSEITSVLPGFLGEDAAKGNVGDRHFWNKLSTVVWQCELVTFEKQQRKTLDELRLAPIRFSRKAVRESST